MGPHQRLRGLGAPDPHPPRPLPHPPDQRPTADARRGQRLPRRRLGRPEPDRPGGPPVLELHRTLRVSLSQRLTRGPRHDEPVRGRAGVSTVAGQAVASWPRISRCTAVLTLVGAAVVHESVVQGRYVASPGEAVLLAFLAPTQLALAVALVTSRSRALESAVIALSLGAAALWALSRSVGLPLGAGIGHPQAVGLPDAIAALLEVTTALALLPVALPAPAPASATVLAGLLATAVGLATALAVNGRARTDTGAAAPTHAGLHAAQHPGPPPVGAYGRQGYFVAERPLGPLSVRIGLGPATVGTNTVDLVFRDGRGRPADLHDVFLSARAPGPRAATTRWQADRLAPGHYVVDRAPLTTGGWWRVRITVRAASNRPLRTAVVVPVDKH